ncbi:hypothetical protein K439DRAFT_1637782 [Ramaria rubella]|nr:hypothetical protein K439DRAFT_1637782 [Ramaria rubella]
MRFLSVGLLVFAAAPLALSAPVLRHENSNDVQDNLYRTDNADSQKPHLTVFNRGGGRPSQKTQESQNSSTSKWAGDKEPVSSQDENPENESLLRPHRPLVLHTHQPIPVHALPQQQATFLHDGGVGSEGGL